MTTFSHLKTIRSMLSSVAEEENYNCPAGWFTETELGLMLRGRDLTYAKSRSVEIHPFWHTPLTGLYSKTYHELSLWYPGGRLNDGLKYLEFRPR